jgi:hypothetical protein
MSLIEQKKLHKMNRKEYEKNLRIALKFSSKDEKTSSLYNICDDIFESCR